MTTLYLKQKKDLNDVMEMLIASVEKANEGKKATSMVCPSIVVPMSYNYSK